MVISPLSLHSLNHIPAYSAIAISLTDIAGDRSPHLKFCCLQPSCIKIKLNLIKNLFIGT
ncbi:hypothetical protein IQ244_23450 [Nostoc sp. LEGE 06077]|uniref:hypothetical protein n=1 Tax=Nostoc sp. LEGE 06077 TaxID=915325 RepID=UPI00187F82AA|nr:hypothetical protein [Nostoc sp. LEGE 06077]MBE9209402.1 hypothetical protein [Nostoc sp. LEGE 06077]